MKITYSVTIDGTGSDDVTGAASELADFVVNIANTYDAAVTLEETGIENREQFPIDRCAVAAVPLLVETRLYLGRLGSPQATRIEERITNALAHLIELAGEAQAYGNRWCPDTEIGALAGKLAEATAEYDRIDRGEV